MTTTLRSTILPTFAIAINGVHRFTMGLENHGSVGAVATFVRREKAPDEPALTFDATGLAIDSAGRTFLHWDRCNLRVGDAVTLRLGPPSEFDAPVSSAYESADGEVTFHGPSELLEDELPWPTCDSNGIAVSDVAYTPAFQVLINDETFCVTQTQQYRVTMALINAVTHESPDAEPPSTEVTVGPFLDAQGNQLPEPYRNRRIHIGDTITIHILAKSTST